MTDQELLQYRLEVWRCLGALPDGFAVRQRIAGVLAEAVSADRVQVERRGHARSPVGSHRVRVNSAGGGRQDLWVERDRPLSQRERKRLRALWQEAEEVLEVSARSEEVAEGERHRQAVRLHQGPAQALVHALLALQLYRRETDRDPTAARKLLNEAVELVQLALDALREAIRALKCGEGAFCGMEQAIRDTWTRLRAFTGACLVLDLERPGDLPRQVEEGLAAVACEAIANAARHARASRIEVRMRQVRGTVTLEVLDDGKGMGIGAALRHTRRSFGLLLMEEQVARLRGRLRIRSGLWGTGIRVVVPLGERRRKPRGARNPEVMEMGRRHAHSSPAR
ncbi:MAG: histidine kinase [Armatimonadetes bacterium]|nr:histidine kinase [Armatimonadota bacterium]MDW8153873.1 histidine kinase [Armatimonadota bacterium]